MDTMELQEIVTTLSGNASPYIAMLEEASRRTESKGTDISSAISDTSARVSSSLDKVGATVQDYAKHTDDTKRKIDMLVQTQDSAEKSASGLASRFEKVGKSLKDIGQKAVDAGESISKLTGGLEFWDSFKGFAEAEKSERGLNAMLKANQRDVEDTMESYKEFADQIEEMTTTEGDLVIELLKQAEALDVTGASAKRAVRNAMALAEQTGKSAESFIKATSALEQGSAKAVSEYIPALRAIKDESEKSIEAQRILSSMYTLVGDRVDTTAGKIEQLNNMWGNFKESIGEVISQALAPIVTFLQDVIREFKLLPEWLQKGVAGFLVLIGAIGGLITTVGTAIVTFTALATAIGVAATKAIFLNTALIAMKATAVIAVAYAFYEVGKAISGASKAQEDFNRSLDKSGKLNDKWGERFTDSTQKVLKSVESIQDRMAKKQAIGIELERAQKELSGYKSMVEASTKEVDSLNTRWNRAVGSKMLQTVKSELDGHNKKLELARKRVEELQKIHGEIKPPQEDPEIQKAIDKLNESLDKQRKTIGMTGDEVKMYEIRLMGAKEEMLAATKALIDLNRRFAEFERMANSAKAAAENLNTQALEFDLEMRGATDAEKQLKVVDGQIVKMKEELARFKDPLFAPKVDPKEIARLEERLKDTINNREIIAARIPLLKLFERENKLLDDGAQITKQYLTPLQKYAETVNNLKTLLSSGIITQETFNAAMDDAAQSFKNTQQSVKELRNEIERFNHVEFGSREAQDRIEDFLNKTKTQFDEQRKQIEREQDLERQMREARDKPIKLTMDESARESEAIRQLRDFMDKLRRIEDTKIPFRIPDPIPGRAKGGPVIKDELYMVGERGPELFVPNNSGKIVPNHELNKDKIDRVTSIMHDFEMPKIQSPVIPNVRVEPVRMPEIIVPQIPVPKLPNLETGKLPTIKTDKIETLSIEIPKVDPINIDVPKIPKLDVEKIEAPRMIIPKIEVPRIDVPKLDVPKIDLPPVRLDVQKLPTLEVPKIDVPKIQTPKIEVPNMRLPMFDIPNLTFPVGDVPKLLKTPSLFLQDDRRQRPDQRVEVTSRADASVTEESRESNRILRSIDTTLTKISNNPGISLTASDLET